MAYLNNLVSSEGFLPSAKIKDPKTTPTPIPAPANPIVAKPAPQLLPKVKMAENQGTGLRFSLGGILPPIFSLHF
jgi:hypothetical protein